MRESHRVTLPPSAEAVSHICACIGCDNLIISTRRLDRSIGSTKCYILVLQLFSNKGSGNNSTLVYLMQGQLRVTSVHWTRFNNCAMSKLFCYNCK